MALAIVCAQSEQWAMELAFYLGGTPVPNEDSSGMEFLLVPIVLIAFLVVGAIGAMSRASVNITTYSAPKVAEVPAAKMQSFPAETAKQYDVATEWILGLDKAGHVDKHSTELVNYDSTMEWLKKKQCLNMKLYMGCHPPLKSERAEISCQSPDGRWVLIIISTLIGTAAGDGTIISIHQKGNENLIMATALNRDNCQPPISVSP